MHERKIWQFCLSYPLEWRGEMRKEIPGHEVIMSSHCSPCITVCIQNVHITNPRRRYLRPLWIYSMHRNSTTRNFVWRVFCHTWWAYKMNFCRFVSLCMVCLQCSAIYFMIGTWWRPHRHLISNTNYTCIWNMQLPSTKMKCHKNRWGNLCNESVLTTITVAWRTAAMHAISRCRACDQKYSVGGRTAPQPV